MPNARPTSGTPAGPKPRQRISRPGLELIKSFEGLRRRSARLPGGRFVVGYGHIRSAREGVEVSEADAEALLRYDLLPVEAAMNEWTFAPLSQNQFDALCSFAFSIGLRTFRHSDVLRYINEGAMLQAAGALEMWRRVELEGEGVIVDALVRRRAVEKALFLQPAEGYVPAPSAVLKPRIDYLAYQAVPRRRPEQVQTPLDGSDALAVRAAPETRDAPETDWSPPKAAAANVNARLSELVADDEPEGPEFLPFDLPAPDDGTESAEPLDGDFLQAPPSPPEDEPSAPDDLEDDGLLYGTDADDDDAVADAPDPVFPELDLHAQPAPDPEPEPEPEPQPEPATPVVELAELPPFPQDANLPSLSEATAPEPAGEAPGADLPEGFGQNSGAEASGGDPAALSRPVEGPDNGPYIYLFLAGLALVVAAAVTFFRTPDPGAAPTGSGLGWVLGLLGIAGVAGALWAIMGREDALDQETGEEEEA
ncbi:MAG: lysozyme [Proteobacteria bacterium]|nr:lysozyme [Pseudomonadota bacterium]